MLLNPAIIALLMGSVLITAFALFAVISTFKIRRYWDIHSGSELQLALERRTYLVSTIFSYLLGFELLSLVLFIFTADHMHNMFIGAMCAAGSLNVNEYGYLALVVKLLGFVLCGVWMMVNYLDNQAHDYPLIQVKYRLLVPLALVIGLDTILQYNYFTALKADVITSCCGTIFSGENQGLSGSMAALPPMTTAIVFYTILLLTIRVGIGVIVNGRGALLYGICAGTAIVVSLAAVISFISPYYYQLPTHHCPFCLLQKDYHYIGYPLYLALLIGGTTGIGTGLMEKMQGPASLTEVIPRLRQRFTVVSVAAFVIFVVLASYPIVFADFVLNS